MNHTYICLLKDSVPSAVSQSPSYAKANVKAGLNAKVLSNCGSIQICDCSPKPFSSHLIYHSPLPSSLSWGSASYQFTQSADIAELFFMVLEYRCHGLYFSSYMLFWGIDRWDYIWNKCQPCCWRTRKDLKLPLKKSKYEFGQIHIRCWFHQSMALHWLENLWAIILNYHNIGWCFNIYMD